jgi:hypothetical protein
MSLSVVLNRVDEMPGAAHFPALPAFAATSTLAGPALAA